MTEAVSASVTRLPVLYPFRRCPCAVRARMALAASGSVIELREMRLRNKPQAMLDLSGKGTVPVLQLSDGHVLDQSLDVMHRALHRADRRAGCAAIPGSTVS